MSRDYKPRGRRRKSKTPGWVWFLSGLGVGLAVALAVQLNHVARDRTADAPVAKRAARPASEKEEEAGAAKRDDGSGFDFYTMLPDLEVVVPQEDTRGGDPRPDAREMAPGRYWLQAGSFRRHEDADRRKAQLALLGFASGIQAVSLDGQTWHRVRIGPLESATAAEAARRRLAENGIGSLAVREKE